MYTNVINVGILRIDMMWVGYKNWSNIELGYHSLIGPNYGYYIDQAPQEVLNELKVQIDILQNNFNKGVKANESLAGEIQHEYVLDIESKTRQYIKDLTQRFENESKYISTNYNSLPTLSFKDLWINFQSKHEYNPPHIHFGIFSFVIWYQVPFTFENETKYSHKPDGDKMCEHGLFTFQTPNGKKNNILNTYLPVDKSKQGYAVIFPSNLYHSVFPFYSTDEYRISVAGNVGCR